MHFSRVFGLALACMLPVSAQQIPVPGIGKIPVQTEKVAGIERQPVLSPGVLQLMELDGRFSKDVAKGGGAAFASWFAPDAVTLNNKLSPVIGKSKIESVATWKPEEYQLTWYPLGGEMGPSNDMGYTWGHYEGKSKDKDGHAVVLSGRYITVWKKMPDGTWKVAMDASAEEPQAAAIPTNH